MDSRKYYKTKNSRGFMHPLSFFAEKFISFASTTDLPVIDMGCAYGNVVIDGMQKGVKEMIACDMEQAHLDELSGLIDHKKLHSSKSNVTLKQGKFPDGFAFNHNSIGAIHASHVLEYLDDKEIDRGLLQFYHWLKPGGKLFILCYTIYLAELNNDIFKDEYQRRLDNKMKWPGYLEGYDKYASPDDPTAIGADSADFPPDLQMYDKDTLTNALTTLGFVIEFSNYVDIKTGAVVEDNANAGRENLAIIALKP